MQTFTMTFGDQAENYVGMEKIGTLAESGFNLQDLSNAYHWFVARNITCNIYNLSQFGEEAYLFIATNGLSAICNKDAFYQEQLSLPKDTKAYMYGRVVNKRARYNLCFDHQGREANYEEGKGTIISFDRVPLLNQVRLTLPEIIGEKASDLKVEGNYYYDPVKCGIGAHGDAERRKVVGIRTGETMPLRFGWYYKSKLVSSPMDFMLNHGDIYIMSEKAVGTDWRKKNSYTLRHAAGGEKYLKMQ